MPSQPSPLVRLSTIALVVIAGAGAKLALDAAISVQLGYVVTFVVVLIGTWRGGFLVGAAAAAALLVAELAVLTGQRPATMAALGQASFGVEVVTALLAVVLGVIIRTTHARELLSLETANQATRATVDLDRRWSVITTAIADFAALGTPLQVEDALTRHASSLSGRPIRFERSIGRAGPQSPPAPAEAVTTIPVVGASGPLGMLRLATAPAGDDGPPAAAALSDEDGRGLAALGTLAAAALDRIRLRSASGSSFASAERSGERLKRLHELTIRLAALVTPEAIGEVVVGHVLDALHAPVGLFYLTDSAGDLRLAHARGYPIGLAGHDSRLGPGQRMPAADALREGRPVIVESPEAWRGRYPGASDRLGITGTRSVIAWPIGSPATAVLVVQRTVEGPPSDDELAQLEVAGHQAMQAIERARIYAQEREARQLQEAFVGVMSHELRTPITTIVAGSKLLSRDRALKGTSRELALDIEAEADRLFRLVEDLLVLSRLERGSLSVGDEPVHVIRLLQRVVASEAPRWPGSRFELPPERSGFLVRGDETYVEQVVRNLLTNAAKYSPAGTVVRVAIDQEDEDVVVRVLDEGAGVTEAEVERLFGIFYRSPTTAASAAGAGIGLFVCRRLIGAMGGRIWARRRAGAGSEFGFALARYPDDEADAPEPDPGPRRTAAPRADGRAAVPAGIRETGDNARTTGGDAR